MSNSRVTHAATLDIPSLPNLRDLGGRRTTKGRIVRSGLVYRSDEPSHMTAEDLERLAALGLRTVFDLRGEEEAAERPDQVPEGVEYVWLDVLADMKRAGPVLLGQILEDVALANEVLGDGKVDRHFDRAYRGFVTFPSARQAYRELFLGLSDPARLPALFHCLTGKDRTGWAAAALLDLLEVPRDAIIADYLRSNAFTLSRHSRTIEAFVEAGGDRSIPEAVFGVKAQYLEIAFDEVAKRHGTIEVYFEEGLGIDRHRQEQLREILLAG